MRLSAGYPFILLLIGAIALWAYPLTGWGGQIVADRLGLIFLVLGGLWILYDLTMALIQRSRGGGVYINDGY